MPDKKTANSTGSRFRAVTITVLILLMTAAGAVRAEGPAAGPLIIAENLQKAYDSFQTLSADFTQTTIIKMTGRSRRGAGTLTMLKPGRIRWDYLEPDRQVLICDGQTLSMYFEKSNQMIITSAAEYLQSDVTYSFFTGAGDLLKDFQISEIIDRAPDDTAAGIMLIPRKAHPQVSKLSIWTDNDSYLIHKILILDHFDTETTLTFSNIRINTNGSDADPARFDFTPPPATEIIRQ